MWSWTAFFAFLTSPRILEGAWTTIWLTVVSMILGLVLGCGLRLRERESADCEKRREHGRADRCGHFGISVIVDSG